MARIIKPLSSALAMDFWAGILLAEPATFVSPAAATDALVSALLTQDRAAPLAIFGPESEDLINLGDADEDAEAREHFHAEYGTVHQMVPAGDNRAGLPIGRTLWPFPVAMTRSDAGWRFDVAGSHEEILARWIGMDELDVMELLRRAVAVQGEVRKVDHYGDGVVEFASSILSTPRQRDGLYWPPGDGTPDSPIGAFTAHAVADGLSIDGVAQAAVPYLGYLFRILIRQGEAAPAAPMTPWSTATWPRATRCLPVRRNRASRA